MAATTLAARPTLYRGIQMRSRLEAKVAALLDEQRRVWEYEPRCFACPHGQYLPDFLIMEVLEEEGEIRPAWVYLEIKPPPILGLVAGLDEARARMEIVAHSLKPLLKWPEILSLILWVPEAGYATGAVGVDACEQTVPGRTAPWWSCWTDPWTLGFGEAA